MTNVPTNCIPSNTIPKKYVSPLKKTEGPTKKADIPIIDLQGESNITSQIMKACETGGIFLVINHGIPIEKMNKTMKNIEDFHKLPIEEKKKYPLEGDTNKSCVIAFHNEEHMLKRGHWRDALQIECTHLDESIQFWPDNPKKFKEDMRQQVLAVKDLISKILEYLSEGLGLERGYLGGELSANYTVILNHYPPSIGHESTPGFREHVDWNVITVVQSDRVPGLQLFEDGQWLDIETPPEAFLVFLGSQTEVISNGKLKGVLHRVTTSNEDRYSAIYSRAPPNDCLVEPAKDILKAENSTSYYKSFRFTEIAEKLKDVDPRDVDIAGYIRELLTIK